MSDFHAEEVLTFAINIAKQAGAIIREGSAKRINDQNQGKVDVEELIKKNTADLVTETDQKTEKFIKDAISKQFPTHKFIGEESWAAGQQATLTDEPHWIVDPIDGTNGFVHNFVMCCVSIGVTFQSRPTVGVVYAPFLNTLYYARTGAGAFIESPAYGERQLPLAKPMPLPSLKQALLAVEYGSDRGSAVLDKKMESFKRLIGDEDAGIKGGQMVQGVRSIGSAALSCCYVAQGTFDLWHEVGCWAWDVCAGAVIIQEAGGVVVGGKEPTLKSLSTDSFGDITPEVLQGRKYLVIRGVGDSKSEKGSDAQKRIIETFYDTIDEWDAK